MTEKLEKLVGAVLEGLNEALSNDEYEHIYVIDTNIVHGFPEALIILGQEGRESNGDKPNIIILSDVVRRELNNIKRCENIDKAIDARIALKGINEILERYKKIEKGEYSIGIRFKKGSLLFMLPYSESLEVFPKLRKTFGGDDQILSCALTVKEKIPEKDKGKVSVVSDDEDMHTSCMQFGIKSARFGEFYKDYDYTGFVEVNVDECRLYKEKEIYEALLKPQDMKVIPVEAVEQAIEEKILPNQFIRFFGHQIDNKKPFRVRPDGKEATRNLVNYKRFLAEKAAFLRSFGIRQGYVPTWEQECALELLCDPAIDYITLSGPPGGGKTMLPLDVGLVYLNAGKIYSIIVSNPPHENSIGYLPGTKREKLVVENQNIFDALYFLLGVNDISRKNKSEVEEEIERRIAKGDIELETERYVKGRTWPRRMILFDEAEDYEPKHMRKLASRLGQGSKMVFSGDPYQIDNPRCSRTRNGLVYFISKFKGQPNYGHITIKEDVMRSKGAEQSAKLL